MTKTQRSKIRYITPHIVLSRRVSILETLVREEREWQTELISDFRHAIYFHYIGIQSIHEFLRAIIEENLY